MNIEQADKRREEIEKKFDVTITYRYFISTDEDGNDFVRNSYIEQIERYAKSVVRDGDKKSGVYVNGALLAEIVNNRITLETKP